MATLTSWLTIASGGTSLSVGINRPAACTGAAQPRATRRTGNQRCIAEFLSEKRGIMAGAETAGKWDRETRRDRNAQKSAIRRGGRTNGPVHSKGAERWQEQ